MFEPSLSPLSVTSLSTSKKTDAEKSRQYSAKDVPSGRIKVMDLDELADALEQGLITQEQTINCMKQLNDLLTLIYRDKFDTLTEPLDSRGL